MHTPIGSFDAKAKLSALLRKVEEGERFTITVRGRPIADLVPSTSSEETDAATAVANMRSIQKVKGVPGETILKWIAEGRK